jgi:hypothetical protein
MIYYVGEITELREKETKTSINKPLHCDKGALFVYFHRLCSGEILFFLASIARIRRL